MRYPKDKILSEKRYFSLTLSASTDGNILLDGQTMWVGFADEERRIELRALSLVIPERMADFWINFEMPFCVVNDIADFAKWYISGGHALVAKEIVEDIFPDFLKPSACVRLGNVGFEGLAIVPKSAFQKVPTPKKRQEILKRDDYRCKICGRRPADYLDVELHVHHIRPFGNGGLTHEKNLITLCHTCHRGLEPHYEWSLYELVEEKRNSDVKSKLREKYLAEVKQYRTSLTPSLEKADR